MRQARPKWPSEAAMFESFCDVHRAAGFSVHPETHGHDLVMVAPDEIKGGSGGSILPGDVIVVEGKLTANAHLLYQAMPPTCTHGVHVRMWPQTRPRPCAHWYVVLVPSADAGYRQLAAGVGIEVCEYPPPATFAGRSASPPRTFKPRFRLRHDPEIVMQRPALSLAISPGQPSPRALTPWKEAAVRLCLQGRDGRTLTRADVGKLDRSFRASGWIEKDGVGKAATYRLLDKPDRPDRAYPEIVAAIEASEAA